MAEKINITKAQIAALATVTAAFRDDMEFDLIRPDKYESAVDLRLSSAAVLGATNVSIEPGGEWSTVSPEGEVLATGKPRDLFRMIATGRASEG